MLPSAHKKNVGTRKASLSRLTGWPTCSPVNASRTASRPPAHDSGPMWIATPSLQWTCTIYSLPVSRRTPAPTPVLVKPAEPDPGLEAALARLGLGVLGRD